MKRNALQRLSTFLPKPKNRLTLQQLESRDVPAIFTVDPTVAVPFGNTYTYIDQAIAAAALNSEADTINLTANTHLIRNTGGNALVINDNLTFVGNGKTTSILTPQFDVNSASPYQTPLFQIGTGSVLNVQDLGFNGTGIASATVFKYEGGSGAISNTDYKGYGTSPGGYGFEGEAIWARSGGVVTITGSSFTNTQARSSVYVTSGVAAQSNATVTNSTFTGLGEAGLSFGIEIRSNSKATISGNTFSNHSNGENSAGIYEFASSGYSPEATILRNTFNANENSIVVGSGVVGDASSALIAYNTLTGNSVASIQNFNAPGSGVVNARFNWFGSSNGPSGGNSALGPVNFSQFLRAPLGTVEDATVSNNARFVTAPNSTANGVNQPAGYFSNAANNNAGFAAATPTTKTYPLVPIGTPAGNPNKAVAAETGETRTAFVDLNGDGFNEIIVSSGTSELVSIYNGVGAVFIKSFSGLTGGISAAKFAGGVYVAGGDINGDGIRDLIVSQGAFDPRVVVYSGQSALTASPTRIVDFIDATNRGSLALGVTVAAGDFNGDGFDDIVTGAIQPLASTAINSNVRVFDGKALTTNPNAVPNANPALALNRTTDNVTPNVDFFAYLGSATGVYVAAADVNGDGRAELVTGAARLGANLRAFSFTAGSLLAPTTFASGTTTPTLAADFTVGASNAGVRVAARDLNNDGYADILWTLGTGAPPVGVISGQSLTLTGPASGIAPPIAPVGYTLLTAAYTASSKGAFVA